MRSETKVVRLIARLKGLKKTHAKLEHSIQNETARPLPDGLIVQRLKRMRLKVRDEIFMVVKIVKAKRTGLQPHV